MVNTQILRTSMFMLASFTALSAQTYQYQTFSAFGSRLTQAADVAPDGRIVGSFATDFYESLHGFVSQNGSFTEIDYPETGDATLVAVNSAQILGNASPPEGATAFLIDSKSNITRIRVPAATSSYETTSQDLNQQGVVVGYYLYRTGPQHAPKKAFTYQNGRYTTYSVPGSFDTQFNSVNRRGVTVGTYDTADGAPLQGFKLANGRLTPIAFPGAQTTIPTGINDSGQIVGTYYLSAGGAANLFHFDGKTYKTIAPPPNTIYAYIAHITNSNQIVGYAYADDSIERGFVGTPAN